MESIELIVTPPKKVVSIKLDVDLIEHIDRVWKELGYSSRSEFIREAILYYLVYLSRRKQSPRSDSAKAREVIAELEKILAEIEA